jgi:hypothetical protein
VCDLLPAVRALTGAAVQGCVRRRGLSVVLELTAGLLIAAVLGLMVYSLVETVEAPRSRVRHLPVWAWQLTILVPVAGAVAWLVYGRPRAGHRIGTSGPASTRRRPARWDGPAQTAFADSLFATERLPVDWPVWPVEHPPRVIGPDDDPEFIAHLARMVEQLQHEGGHPARTDDGDEVL